MKILFFFFCQLMLTIISAEEQPKWVGDLFDRMEHLEKKDAEKDAIIAELQENLKTCSCEPNAPRNEQLNGAYLQRRFVLNDGPVAFTAAITPTVVNHLKHYDTVRFETTITSIGSGYNNQTGVFVVPMSGIYMFSCSLLDDHDTGVMVHGEIVQNQRVLGRVFAHAEVRSDVHYRDQGAQTVFTQARAGDHVWVRVIDNGDLGLGGELYSSFSGYLLYSMD